ncbi:MAG: hypothetical protein ACLVG5_09925 [Clostridium sp.]
MLYVPTDARKRKLDGRDMQAYAPTAAFLMDVEAFEKVAGKYEIGAMEDGRSRT